MWIGDFVRCHTVVRLLSERFPDRPVDMLATTLCAPLADYMPGLRQAIVVDLPRGRLAIAEHRKLAARLKRENYATALVMPRTWKSALAPFFAGIPERTGFVGEMRFGLLNDLRPGEKALPRMVDRCAALALPRDAALPAEWPQPELRVPSEEAAAWRRNRGLAADGNHVVAFCPGAVGPSKRWPTASYARLAASLGAKGFEVWVLGGPNEKGLATEIAAASPARPHRHRSARRRPRACERKRRGVERFRPSSCRRSAWYACDRHFRANQPMALGAAQSARRDHRNKIRASLPAVPQAGLPAGSSPLHDRDRAGRSFCGRAERGRDAAFTRAGGTPLKSPAATHFWNPLDNSGGAGHGGRRARRRAPDPTRSETELA